MVRSVAVLSKALQMPVHISDPLCPQMKGKCEKHKAACCFQRSWSGGVRWRSGKVRGGEEGQVEKMLRKEAISLIGSEQV